MIQGQLGLHKELKASLDYLVRQDVLEDKGCSLREKKNIFPTKMKGQVKIDHSGWEDM